MPKKIFIFFRKVLDIGRPEGNLLVMAITPKGNNPASISPAGFVLQIHETIAGKQVFLTEDMEESSLYFAKVFKTPHFVYPQRGFWRAVDEKKNLLAVEVANPPKEDEG